MRAVLVILVTLVAAPGLAQAVVTDPVQDDPGTMTCVASSAVVYCTKGGDASDAAAHPTPLPKTYGAQWWWGAGTHVPVDDPEDHYSFGTTGGTTVTVHISPTNFAIDVALYVTAPGGATCSQDAGGAGFTETCTFSPAPAGTYTVSTYEVGSAKAADAADDRVPKTSCLLCPAPGGGDILCEVSCGATIQPPSVGGICRSVSLCAHRPVATHTSAPEAVDVDVQLAVGVTVRTYTLVTSCEPYCLT